MEFTLKPILKTSLNAVAAGAKLSHFLAAGNLAEIQVAFEVSPLAFGGHWFHDDRLPIWITGKETAVQG